MSKYRVGVDVGGTKTEAVLIDSDDKTIWRERVPTEREKGADHIQNNISGLINRIFNETDASPSELKGIGIGLPGSVDPISGKMINGNTTCLIDVDIKAHLHNKLDFSPELIFTANDANCFALAEAKMGVGKDFRKNAVGIGIIIGTGCGGGLTIGQNIFNGSRGGALEVGHTNLVPDGDPCYCGSRGCAELYLSGRGVENSYSKNYGEKKYATEILAEKSHRDVYQRHLLQFLNNLTNLFDPDYFVFGGGLSKDEDLYRSLENKLESTQFLKGKAGPKLLKNQLGDSAGVFGAAFLTL